LLLANYDSICIGCEKKSKTAIKLMVKMFFMVSVLVFVILKNCSVTFCDKICFFGKIFYR